jgi:hypothetical protein
MNWDWSNGLSVRAANCLHNIGATNKKKAMKAMIEGRLMPPRKGHGGVPRNYGWKTHLEVREWLGLPEYKPPSKKVWASVCPHCGKNLV